MVLRQQREESGAIRPLQTENQSVPSKLLSSSPLGPQSNPARTDQAEPTILSEKLRRITASRCWANSQWTLLAGGILLLPFCLVIGQPSLALPPIAFGTINALAHEGRTAPVWTIVVLISFYRSVKAFHGVRSGGAGSIRTLSFVPNCERARKPKRLPWQLLPWNLFLTPISPPRLLQPGLSE